MATFATMVLDASKARDEAVAELALDFRYATRPSAELVGRLVAEGVLRVEAATVVPDGLSGQALAAALGDRACAGGGSRARRLHVDRVTGEAYVQRLAREDVDPAPVAVLEPARGPLPVAA